MKNFSSLVKENNDSKTFKYTVNVTIEGTVTAASEGDAGELIDKEIDEISNVIDYKIDSIDEIEKIVKENSIDTLSGDDVVNSIYQQIVDCYERESKELTTPYYQAMLISMLKLYFNKK